MLKTIDPGTPAIHEVYCDSCNTLMGVEGKEQETPTLMALFVSANFGNRSSIDGTYFAKSFCQECGFKAIIALETVLDIKLQHVFE